MKSILLFLFLGFSAIGLAQETYKLSEESKLTIDGTSTVHDWTVAANKMEGNLKVKDNAPVAIQFNVAVADIISERGAAMDKKMHKALKKEEHPKVSFALTEVKNTSVLVGTLSIAGTKKDVEINADIVAEGNLLKLKGAQKIILQDYGMEPPTAMFGQIIVGDEVTVNFDLVFEKV